MIGKKFCDKVRLDLSFLVVSELPNQGGFMVLHYGKVRDNFGANQQVLRDGEVMTKEAIEDGFVVFDSPAYHQRMKELEREARGY